MRRGRAFGSACRASRAPAELGHARRGSDLVCPDVKDPIDLPISRARLEVLRSRGLLSPGRFEDAIELATSTPDVESWKRFISTALLAAGTALVSVGILFLVAFNWAELHRLQKLALVATLLCATTVAAVVLGETRSGRASLAMSSIVVGALLAVFGQVYQTGADTWQLFAAWAALALPFALLSRTSFMLVIELLLVDIALGLYFSYVYANVRFEAVALAFGIVNGAAWLGAEVAAHRGVSWLTGRTTSRVACALTFLPLASGVVGAIVDDTMRDGYAVGVTLLFVATAVGTNAAHRNLRHDLFTLTVLAGSALFVAATGAGYVIFETLDLDEIGILVEGALLVAGVALAVAWLRQESAVVEAAK